MIKIKNIVKIAIILIIIMCKNNIIYSYDNSKIYDSLNMNEFLQTLKEYVSDTEFSDFDVSGAYNELVQGRKIDYSSFINMTVDAIFKEVKNTLKDSIAIFVIVILMALLNSICLDKNSDTVKIARLVLIISIVTILLRNYLDIASMFKNVIENISHMMQIISTFLVGVLIASGKMTSLTAIKPLILFLSNLVLVICEYVILPLFTISVALNIVSRIGEDIKMDKLSSLIRKIALWAFSGIIAIFLLVLSFETSITKSIDNLYYKTAQSVIEDSVPVVGKFFSDSLGTVIGATQLIGKSGGLIAIIITFLIAIIPVVKILTVVVIYSVMIALSEVINENKEIEKLLTGFLDVYKTMLGIIIGVMAIVIMSSGIILSMIDV